MTSPQKPVVSNTLDPPPAVVPAGLPASACLHDKLQLWGGSTMNAWTPSTNLLCQIHLIPHDRN